MSNLLFETECALLNKEFKSGLLSYTQSNCQVTLTDNGYHIYRPPNLTYPDCGNTVWGGFKLDPLSLSNGLLVKGNTYIILFDVKGTSSNQGSIRWDNQMGWGGGGLTPTPSNVSYSIPPKNFSGEHKVHYKFSINDDIIKTCTSSYSSFVAGEKYVSYRHFYYGFNYESTGTLGTDIYITNIRMYDITNNKRVSINKNGNVNCNAVSEGFDNCSFGSELCVNEIIET